MKATKSSVNINDTEFITVIIPEHSINAIKQKLGDDFIWKYDESSDHTFVVEKPKSDIRFDNEFGRDIPEIANEWYEGKLKNRWDD
ncbi:MAG: hypothetical protein ACOZCL_03985 [Bacillota bacterium]